MSILDDLERLEQAATAGPWAFDDHLIVSLGKEVPDWRETYQGAPFKMRPAPLFDVPYDPEERFETGVDPAADATFIAAARNALPALLAVVRAGRECADDLEAELRNRYAGGMRDIIIPAIRADFERDMEPVERLRAALAALEAHP